MCVLLILPTLLDISISRSVHTQGRPTYHSIQFTMQSISAVLFAAFQLLFIYTFSVSAQILDSDTNVKVVPIYFKPDLPASQATALIKKGLLEYDTFLNKGIFKSLLSREDDIQGKGCFGVIDAENNFNCLSYSDVSSIRIFTLPETCG